MVRLESDIAGFEREINRPQLEMNDGECDEAAA